MTKTIKSRATYDPQADAIGVYFAPDGADYDVSQEVAPGIVLDYDRQGRVIGVELTDVSKLLADALTPNGAQASGNAHRHPQMADDEIFDQSPAERGLPSIAEP